MPVKVNGSYTLRLIEDGREINKITVPNTITLAGDDLLGKYLTDDSERFINYLAVGLNSTANTLDVTDTRLATNIDLGHEIIRKRCLSKAWTDAITNSLKVSYYVNFSPNEAVGVLREIGSFDRVKNEDSDLSDDYLIANFDNSLDGGTWTLGTIDTTNFVEGESSLSTGSVSANTTSTMRLSTNFDLSGYQTVDKIQIMARMSNIAQSVEVRFETDQFNYYSKVFSAGFTGAAWNLLSSAISGYAPTGAPDWSEITSIAILGKANAASATTFNYNSLRTITANSNSTMFSRAVINTTKTSKQELLVSYDIQFNF